MLLYRWWKLIHQWKWVDYLFSGGGWSLGGLRGREVRRDCSISWVKICLGWNQLRISEVDRRCPSLAVCKPSRMRCSHGCRAQVVALVVKWGGLSNKYLYLTGSDVGLDESWNNKDLQSFLIWSSYVDSVDSASVSQWHFQISRESMKKLGKWIRWIKIKFWFHLIYLRTYKVIKLFLGNSYTYILLPLE